MSFVIYKLPTSSSSLTPIPQRHNPHQPWLGSEALPRPGNATRRSTPRDHRSGGGRPAAREPSPVYAEPARRHLHVPGRTADGGNSPYLAILPGRDGGGHRSARTGGRPNAGHTAQRAPVVHYDLVQLERVHRVALGPAGCARKVVLRDGNIH